MTASTAADEAETGFLDTLNCGYGHLTVKFDKDKPEEVVKARKMIGDMLRRGYVIMIQTEDGGTKRVKRFDPKTDEYIVDDPEPQKRRLPVRKAKATSIGRTAGG